MRNAGDMASLISHAQMFADRLLVDATGLAGSFEWELTSALDRNALSEASLIATAFKEQLGLMIRAREVPMNVLVIDSVEMPTEN